MGRLAARILPFFTEKQPWLTVAWARPHRPGAGGPGRRSQGVGTPPIGSRHAGTVIGVFAAN